MGLLMWHQVLCCLRQRLLLHSLPLTDQPFLSSTSPLSPPAGERQRAGPHPDRLPRG